MSGANGDNQTMMDRGERREERGEGVGGRGTSVWKGRGGRGGLSDMIQKQDRCLESMPHFHISFSLSLSLSLSVSLSLSF
jgi:hypothetical protein